MIQTINLSKARLFAGGTYFVSLETGLDANTISITLNVLGGSTTMSVNKPQNGTSCLYSGSNVSDISTIVFFGTDIEIFTVVAIDSKTWNVTGSVSGLLGTAKGGKVFRNAKLTFLIETDNHLPGDKFIISSGTTETYTASSIASMRTQVNANSNLIAMPARGTDVQDTGTDASNFSSIPQTWMTGGNGFPQFPSYVNMPIPMVFLNYEEIANGVNTVVSHVYTWQGTQSAGVWITTDTSIPIPDPT